MAESVSSRTPNLRFGTSFLNTKYRDRAVGDEALMDKSTGEIALKRKSDGQFIYFNREEINIESWLLYMRSVYESNLRTVHPTDKNCTEYAKTYLIGTQFDLEEFKSNLMDKEGNRINDFSKGALLLNPDPKAYNISHEMNGMFVDVKANTRGVQLVNLISSIYDRYFKNYSGSVPSHIAEKNKFIKSAYETSTVEVNYTITYTNKDGSTSNSTFSGYCGLNKPSYIMFDDYAIRSRKDVLYATLTINYVTLPKVKAALEIKDTVFSNDEKALYDRLLDENTIELKCMDIFTYTTTSDTTYALPPDSTKMVFLMTAPNVEETFSRLSTISNGHGVTTKLLSPTDDEWYRLGEWNEKIRMALKKGDTEDLGAKTSISDMEAFFGKIEEVEAPFILNINEYGFYLKELSRTRITMPW